MKGFTLIEIMTTIGIMAVLAGFSYPLYDNWRSVSLLDATVSEAVNILRLAEYKSASGMDDSAYGVFFEPIDGRISRMVLYKGDSYDQRVRGSDESYDIGDRIILETDPQGNDIHFKKYSGFPETARHLDFIDRSTGNGSAVLINPIGLVEIN
jgi:prepilin-type N-terminal cleavage/methylation domain-containing protein